MKQSSHIHPREKETLIKKKKKVSSFAADLWELFPPAASHPHPAQTKSTRYAKEGRGG